MPRIPGPEPARAPGQILSLPRPREVRAAPTGLVEFGRPLEGIGQQLFEFAVSQERKAETLRIKTLAEERYGELRREVDAASTSAEGRALWTERGPKLREEIAKFARERGLPELTAELDLIAATQNNEVLAALNKRSWREAVDAGNAFAAAKGRAIVAAQSEPEAKRHKVELHRALEQLALDNPLVTPVAADELFRETVEVATRDRVLAQISSVADDPAGLAAMRDALRDPERFPDLRLDDRGELVRQTLSLADALENREWRRLQRQEVLLNRQREQMHLGTLEMHSQILSEGGFVSDSQLLAEVARGEISIPYVNFLQRQRDGMVAETVDLDIYRELRSAAEVGLVDTADIEAALASGALGSGTSAVGIARDLIDLSESAERQGGIFRRRDFIEAEDLVSLALRGVTRDAPITLLEDPGDEKANEFVLVTSAVRRNVLTLLEQGTPADQINPFALYGEALRRVGATRPRPVPPVFSGLDTVNRVLATGTAAEVEVVLQTLRERAAEQDTQEARDMVADVKLYVQKLRLWDTAQQAAEALINAIPPEERR